MSTRVENIKYIMQNNKFSLQTIKRFAFPPLSRCNKHFPEKNCAKLISELAKELRRKYNGAVASSAVSRAENNTIMLLVLKLGHANEREKSYEKT